MADNKEHILYRPVLELERNYRSEAVFQDNSITNPDPPTLPDQSKGLIDDFEELKNIISIAPPAIHPIIQTINKLIRRLQVAFPNGYYGDEPEAQKEIVYKGGTNIKKIDSINSTTYKSTNNFGGLPNLFPKPTNIAIDVVKPRSIVNIAIDKYRKDTIDLQKYYLSQLQTALQTYFHQMLMIMAEVNLPNVDSLMFDFDGKAVKIPAGQNLEHLRDYIVRSQIVREQKSRLFRKTHNVDQTVMHMRAWHVSEKERERYYSEQYGSSATYLDSEGNAILRECRSTYDKQYAQSLYDMYKYLNSSVIVVSDILDMSLKEAKAKGALLKAGVDIFAVMEKKVVVNDDVASAVGSSKLDEPTDTQSADNKENTTADSSSGNNSSSSDSKEKTGSFFDIFKPDSSKSIEQIQKEGAERKKQQEEAKKNAETEKKIQNLRKKKYKVDDLWQRYVKRWRAEKTYDGVDANWGQLKNLGKLKTSELQEYQNAVSDYTNYSNQLKSEGIDTSIVDGK